ncbi:hypothetical protein LCGC14_1379020 [marine sediment metagenome]|uniref:Uncharacterized protein n=1 Tax=marine sediment metagenome TaxID=412755 RepID=A0A0F9K3L5_9ZZZZ
MPKAKAKPKKKSTPKQEYLLPYIEKYQSIIEEVSETAASYCYGGLRVIDDRPYCPIGGRPAQPYLITADEIDWLNEQFYPLVRQNLDKHYPPKLAKEVLQGIDEAAKILSSLTDEDDYRKYRDETTLARHLKILRYTEKKMRQFGIYAKSLAALEGDTRADYTEPTKVLAGREIITLKGFIERYCDLPLGGTLIKSKADLLYGYERNTDSDITLPKLARKWTSGQSRHYYTDDLIRKWPKYVDKISTLPPLKSTKATKKATEATGSDFSLFTLFTIYCFMISWIVKSTFH